MAHPFVKNVPGTRLTVPFPVVSRNWNRGPDDYCAAGIFRRPHGMNRARVSVLRTDRVGTTRLSPFANDVVFSLSLRE
jgi:hypothetical protein